MLMRWDYEVDVAVVGGGACGLTAALAAGYGERPHSRGDLQVAVFEKSTALLSNADISSGTLAAAGTRWQRELGIDDSPEAHLADIMKKNGDEADIEIVRALCEAAPHYTEWLADEFNVPLMLHADARRIGHSAPRLHSDPGREGGKVLMGSMRRAVDGRSNVHLVDQTPGVGLIVEEDRVVGIRVQENDVERTVRAQAVVLACDGFGANREMVAEFIPELTDAPYIGVEGNRGDAIHWAREVGAELVHMGAYQGHGFVIVGHYTRLNPQIVIEGGIIVNEDGRRFAAEDIGYSELAPVLLKLPKRTAVEIWDGRIQDRLPPTELMRDSEKAGAFSRHETLEELASSFGLAVDVLSAEIERYNDGVLHGEDEFARSALVDPLQPPFYAARITPALAHTQGGIRVDVRGQALRPDASPIEGLFAGGGSAVGISGSGPHGYMSANGLLSAVGGGYLIGNHLRATL
jgi:fumarate reductase flavoprotein subunit